MLSVKFVSLRHLLQHRMWIVGGTLLLIAGVSVVAWLLIQERTSARQLQQEMQRAQELDQKYQEVREQLQAVLSEDQYQRNEALQQRIAAIEQTYTETVKRYEKMVDLGGSGTGKAQIEENFALALQYLAEQNYASSQAVLAQLDTQLAAEETRQAAATVTPNLETLAVSSTPPDSGFSRQAVETPIGHYQVSIVSADLNSTRVIVDTASASDCSNDCPVLSLSSYVARNGAFAGINGSYFCPASYPSCAGKTNTFDTLLMNKDKTYFNSDNNVYSTVPAVIFSGNSARFVSRSLEWGRDTNVDAVLANQPLLVNNGTVVFGGDGDPKKGSKGNRSFVGATGSKVYIGVVHNATVAEAAIVLHSLGIQNALNLDSGGSTALWSDGYKAGPGRDIPNALLFVRK